MSLWCDICNSYHTDGLPHIRIESHLEKRAEKAREAEINALARDIFVSICATEQWPRVEWCFEQAEKFVQARELRSRT